MWHNCNTEEDCKKLFKKLAFRLHPDHCGSNELMILLQESFDTKIKSFSRPKHPSKNESKKTTNKPTPTSEWKKGDSIEKRVENVSIYDEELLFMMHKIIEYSKSNKKFKTDYIESIMEFGHKHRYITSNQFNSLVKIYYAFKMNE